jgi:ComF family protein
MERPPAFDRAWTLYPYVPPLQDAICLFKYRGKVGLAKPLAQLMLGALPRTIDVDAILPVPLHPTRLRAREFNQSLLLAERLGRHLGKPVLATALARVLPTNPQTTLTRQERRRNLRRAFTLFRPEAIAERRILLVDDVFTTGTTLDECARVLRKAGAASVCALTLARTMESHLVPDRVFAERTGGMVPELGL